MSAIEQVMLEKFRVLPLEKQQEALQIVEAFARETALPRQRVIDESNNSVSSTAAPDETSAKPIWEVIEELSARVPAEDWRSVPTDGAAQHDHYLYGAPKR